MAGLRMPVLSMSLNRQSQNVMVTCPESPKTMKAFVIRAPGVHSLEQVPEPSPQAGEVLLRVRMIGFCGTDLSSFRGANPMVAYPCVPGHEIAATVEDSRGNAALPAGLDVTLMPYANCASCAACYAGRPNA